MEAVRERPLGIGILGDEPMLGLPCGAIHTKNYWRGEVGGQSTHVCAGYNKEDPDQGLIVVVRWPSKPPTPRNLEDGVIPEGGIFQPPTRAGVLVITNMVGNRLTLSSQNSTIFYFDLATLQWVNP